MCMLFFGLFCFTISSLLSIVNLDPLGALGDKLSSYKEVSYNDHYQLMSTALMSSLKVQRKVIVGSPCLRFPSVGFLLIPLGHVIHSAGSYLPQF